MAPWASDLVRWCWAERFYHKPLGGPTRNLTRHKKSHMWKFETGREIWNGTSPKTTFGTGWNWWVDLNFAPWFRQNKVLVVAMIWPDEWKLLFLLVLLKKGENLGRDTSRIQEFFSLCWSVLAGIAQGYVLQGLEEESDGWSADSFFLNQDSTSRSLTPKCNSSEEPS